MNSENVDTELSLQMHKLQTTLCPFCVCWGRCVGGGGGGGGGGRGLQGTLCSRDNTVCRPHSAQGTTQFVDHKLTRIIQKEPQSLIKYFVSS